jgi:excisionase family DNA binding protein
MTSNTTSEHWAVALEERRQRLLTYPQVARQLGVSTRTIARMVARGELDYVPVGDRVRIRQGTLDDWVDTAERRGSGTTSDLVSARGRRPQKNTTGQDTDSPDRRAG